MRGTIFPLLIMLLVFMGTGVWVWLLRHEWRKRGDIGRVSPSGLLARFPVLDSVRVALLLAAASTLLSVLIVALFSFREASQHDPSVSSVALHQFLWSLPCAAVYALAIHLFASRMAFKGLAGRISLVTVLILMVTLFAPAGPIFKLVGGMLQLLFGIVPLSVMSTLDKITIHLGAPRAVVPSPFPHADYGNLALAAGALVFLMLVIEAIIRRVRAAPG